MTRGQKKFCSRACIGQYHSKGFVPPEFPPPPTASKSLERWALEARECNLDYGTYRRLIESGKTYGELRARAKDHGLQSHAPRGHWLSRN